jgi:hypothetical protein
MCRGWVVDDFMGVILL